MKKVTKIKIKAIIKTGLIMIIGLLIFKYIPMIIFGNDIKFDASAHITIASFILYILWFFIDQNKNWHTLFFIFSLVVISIISLQRIMVNAHNDIGLLGGIIISCIAIFYSQRKFFRDKISF